VLVFFQPAAISQLARGSFHRAKIALLAVTADFAKNLLAGLIPYCIAINISIYYV
jgi:hypothetical protein